MIDKEALLNDLQDDVDYYERIIKSNIGLGEIIDEISGMKAAKEVLIENIKSGKYDIKEPKGD